MLCHFGEELVLIESIDEHLLAHVSIELKWISHLEQLVLHTDEYILHDGDYSPLAIMNEPIQHPERLLAWDCI